MPSNHLILCLPLLLPPSIFPRIRVFRNYIRWPKYWSLSFSISPSSEYSRLISYRIDWFDILAVQRTLKSLLRASQFESINTSALSLLYGPTLTSIHGYWKKINHLIFKRRRYSVMLDLSCPSWVQSSIPLYRKLSPNKFLSHSKILTFTVSSIYVIWYLQISYDMISVIRYL